MLIVSHNKKLLSKLKMLKSGKLSKRNRSLTVCLMISRTLEISIKLTKILNKKLSQFKKVLKRFKYKKMTPKMNLKSLTSNCKIILKFKNKSVSNLLHQLKTQFITLKKLNNSLLKCTNNCRFYKNNRRKISKLQILKIWWVDSIDFKINNRPLVISRKQKSIKIWKINCLKMLAVSRQHKRKIKHLKNLVKTKMK